MAAIAPTHRAADAGFAGLRLAAEQFFALPDDGRRYELLDGIVIMSPGPKPGHQYVAGLVYRRLAEHVERRQLGLVLYETDVFLGEGPLGRDLVYRPEIVFVRAERVQQIRARIEVPPDVVIEVVSPESRSLDTRTKRDDYERAGVGEYWLIDPQQDSLTFLCLEGGRYHSVATEGDRFESRVVPGFALDLAEVRAAFRRL